jgi:hypothetical protein
MQHSTMITRTAYVRQRILFFWMPGLILAGLLLFMLARFTIQITHPSAAAPLQLVQDIPLPSAFPDVHRTSKQPFAPGLALQFDHFDFQVLDPQLHLLFIAHSGPSPDREQLIDPKFNPDTDAKTDGNIIVFDTLQKKVVGLVNVPQVAGITLASDLGRVYAADSNDNIIYAIDEHTLATTPIPLQDNDSPDGIEYDQPDHLLFVSDPGTPANPDKTQVIDRKNQNETIIDTLTNKVVARLPLGIDGKWGDDVGHVRFDPTLHRVYVAVQQLPDPDDPNPNLLPPPDTSWLVEINPITRQIVMRLKLPHICLTPHGMAIDASLNIAAIACVDADPASIIRIDLQSMQAMSEQSWPVEISPDILVLDHAQHLLYVACGAGISIFKENGRQLQWIGNYTFGVDTHTLTVNEATHEIYVPVARLGNRPVLMLMRYTASP